MTYAEEQELKIGCIDSDDILDMFKSADDDIAALQANIDTLQAEIYSLMLEFCPEKIEKAPWEKNEEVGE